jgi:hypothetical protein
MRTVLLHDLLPWCDAARFWCVHAHLKSGRLLYASFMPVGTVGVPSSPSTTIDPLLKLGDLRLLLVSQPVACSAFGPHELRLLVRDMFDTMHAAKGTSLTGNAHRSPGIHRIERADVAGKSPVKQTQYILPMKSAVIPQIRVEPELRAELESVLNQGETLTAFVEASVRSAIAFRRVQTSFHARAQAASDEYHRTGVSVPVKTVLEKLQSKLDAKRQKLGR